MAGVTSLPRTLAFGTVAAAGFSACFLTVFQLAVFLFRSGFVVVVVNSNPNKDREESKTYPDAANPYLDSDLAWDLLLIAAFVLQHSVMASRLWKGLLQWLGLSVLERSLFILATCIALQVLMAYWAPVLQDSVVWALDTSSRAVWVVFSVLTFLGWLSVVGVVMVLDYPELVGIKQVYYDAMGHEPPIQQKSTEYQRLFRNFRHPILTGLLIVLWVVPVMTVSRLVLVLSLSLYTLYGHSLDMHDYWYICRQHRLKKETLRSPRTPGGSRGLSVSYG